MTDNAANAANAANATPAANAASAAGAPAGLDPIQTAHQWLEEAATIVGLEPADATALVRELLDLTKDVAHNRSRPAAPLTAYLVGLASKDVDEARANVAKLKEAVN